MVITEEVQIESRDYWFKTVEFLQQNWALMDTTAENMIKVFFFNDAAGVFDELDYESLDEATRSLTRNGFELYSEHVVAQDFLVKPEPPFHRQYHPNGEIYSSGRHWI